MSLRNWAEQRKALIALFIAFLLTRIFALTKYLWYDQAGWATETYYATTIPYHFKYIPHLPLGVYIYRASMLLFGPTSFAMRIVPFIFSIGIFILIYLFAKRLAGKRAALFSVGVYTASFYAFIANTQIDMDGAIISFFVLLTCYLYHLWHKDLSWRRDIVLSLLLIVISTMRLPVGVMVLGTIGLHYTIENYLRTKSVKRAFIADLKHMLPVSLMFAAGMAAVIGGLYLAYPDVVGRIVSYAFGGTRTRDLMTLVLVGYALLLITPLPFLFLLQRLKRTHLLFYILIGAFAFAAFFMAGSGDIPRYFMPAIPALCILTGIVLSRQRIRWRWLAAGTAIGFIAILALTMAASGVPKGAGPLFASILSMDWDFLFFMMGSSMLPVYIAFIAIIGAYAIMLVSAIGTLLRWKHALLILLSVVLAMNLYLITEYDFSLTQPDMAATGDRIIEEIAKYSDEDRFLYVDIANYFPVTYYLRWNETRMQRLSPFNEFTHDFKAEVNAPVRPSIIAFNNFLQFDEVRVPEGCELRTEITSRGKPAGYIYECG